MVSNQEDQKATHLSVSLNPEIPVQGESFAVVITTTNTVTVTAASLQQSVVAMREGEHSFALFAVPALQPQFASTLTYTFTLASGEQEYYSQAYLIRSGEYLSEYITISDEVAESMTAEVIARERELIYQVFSTRSDEKLWKSPFQLPSQGSITSAFGTRRTYNLFPSSSYHAGTDFSVDGGDTVLAPADGVVVFTAPLTVRGNVVIIDHGWGLISGFWHLAEFSVEDGDVVEEGQPIAIIGNTGLSTGAHLHWEVRLNGIPVNGIQWTEIDSSLP